MKEFNAVMINAEPNHSFVETYTLKKGLKQFGQKGYQAAHGEMKQLHDRAVFKPIDVKSLTSSEKERAMESLIFLVEKRDGRIKERTCANGSTQRNWMEKEETASPTATTEAILLTAVIDAEEGRDVATVDIPNAFVQTDIPDGDEKIIMKIKGALVDMLVEIDPELYRDHVVYEEGSKVLYVQVLKAIYGMLQSAILFYKKLRDDLIKEGFEINPYDPCVANKIVSGKQLTVTWHVDDLKSSHIDPRVNDTCIKWLEKKYGDPKIGKVKAHRGKRHDYLGMTLDYSTPGEVKVDMTDYVKGMINEFPEDLKKTSAVTPSNENLFKVNPKSRKLSKDKAEEFHTAVAKGLFASTRARPDIQPTIAFLCTRVREPTEEDWNKLQ
jgi:hypothetical protein